MATEMGKIQKGLDDAKASVSSTDQRKTPLGRKVDQFGKVLTRLVTGVCALVWIASIPRFRDPTFPDAIAGGIYYAKVAVALGVAAVPEGLPAVITLCLSLGTRRMAKRYVFFLNDALEFCHVLFCLVFCYISNYFHYLCY